MAPFVTEVREVSVRPHTDTLSPIQAVTQDGVQNTFNEVQVSSKEQLSRTENGLALSFL